MVPCSLQIDHTFEFWSMRDFPPCAKACMWVGCVRVVWVSQYGMFWDYSNSLVCTESGQRGYLTLYMTCHCCCLLSKKKRDSRIHQPTGCLMTVCRWWVQRDVWLLDIRCSDIEPFDTNLQKFPFFAIPLSSSDKLHAALFLSILLSSGFRIARILSLPR